MLSKNFRHEVRSLQRKYFEKGRAVLRNIERIDDLSWAMDLFIEMHQRRRDAWASRAVSPRRASAFFRGVLPDLMRQGNLPIHWLEIDGRPVAMEYHLAGGGVLYTYQARSIRTRCSISRENC